MAVLGSEDSEGTFQVEDYCLSGLPYQDNPKLDQILLDGEDRYVVHISQNWKERMGKKETNI